jgi:hypothetical protein
MLNRKAFNFYKSYYEVLNELPEKDKLPFLLAILNKQFKNQEPELQGMAKLAYASVRHSIDAQIQGFMYKTNTPTEGGWQGGTEGGWQGASVQEKEKEKEKEEVQEKEKKIINIVTPLQKFIHDNCPQVSKLEQQLTEDESVKLTNTYPKELIKIKLEAMENKKGLCKTYRSVYKTLNNWCKLAVENKTVISTIPAKIVLQKNKLPYE